MDIEMKKDIDINLIHRLIELYMVNPFYCNTNKFD